MQVTDAVNSYLFKNCDETKGIEALVVRSPKINTKPCGCYTGRLVVALEDENKTEREDSPLF